MCGKVWNELRRVTGLSGSYMLTIHSIYNDKRRLSDKGQGTAAIIASRVMTARITCFTSERERCISFTTKSFSHLPRK